VTLRDTSSWRWRLSQWCWSSGMWCCNITEWLDLSGQYSLIQSCTITFQTTWILSLPDISTGRSNSLRHQHLHLNFQNIYMINNSTHPAVSYQSADTVALHITQCLVVILLTHFANWILFERRYRFSQRKCSGMWHHTVRQTASPQRWRHYNPSNCHKINTCPLIGHDISEDLILVDNSPSSCTKVWRYNRKSYASLHKQCQKTILYVQWGSGLLRGDNNEILTIVGIHIYINTENQEGHRSQKQKSQTQPRNQITHTDVAEMPHCIVTVTWEWRQHVLRTLYYVPHGYMRMEAACSAHTVLRSSWLHENGGSMFCAHCTTFFPHTSHGVSSQTNVFVVTVVSTGNIN